MKKPTLEEWEKEEETMKAEFTAAEITNASAEVASREPIKHLIAADPTLMFILPLFTVELKKELFGKASKPKEEAEAHYTLKDISDGMECWLNPDNDVSCENCAFCKESNHDGACKLAVLRELRKILNEGKANETK